MFHWGVVIFQTIVPPFYKSILFTLKSRVRHHHTDTGLVTVGRGTRGAAGGEVLTETLPEPVPV